MQKLILIITAFVISLNLNAQRYKLLTSEDQLSNSLINKIIQDSQGYIWIATEDGLNRYDGMNVTIYRSDEGNNRIKNNYVQTVFEAKNGDLLIGMQNGLQRYDRFTDSFQTIPLIAKGDTVEAHITSITQDQNGQIWIATSGRGLMIYKDDFATTNTPFEGLSSIDFISSILIDHSNLLWLVSYKNGIYCCDISSGDISAINIENDHIIPANSFVRESNGRIFLNINEGLYYFDEDDHMFLNSGFRSDSKYPAMVSAIATVGDKTYVGTDGNGLFSYDFKTKKTEVVEYFAPYIEFDKAKIHSILVDHDNNLWLGLFQKGLFMMPRTSTDITHYGLRPGGRYNIGSGCVMALETVQNGIWIAIDSDELYFVDNNGRSTHYVEGVPPTIMSIKESQEAKGLWLASYSNGLVHYNYSDGSVTDWNAPLREAFPAFNDRTASLAIDNKGRLWIGTYGNGVFCLDHTTAKNYISTTENIDYSLNEPVNNWINTIYNDGENLWMGTYNGLCCYNIEAESFTYLDEELLKATNRSVIFSICKSNDGQLWLATTKGLISYDPKGKTSKHFDKTDGLAANIIVSLITDNEGRLWAGTYGGVSCIDPKEETIESYYSYNGLQGNEFSRDAVGKDAQGRLYFGGPTGISRFNPLELKPEENDLRIAVTKFLLNGNEIKNAITDNEAFEFSCAEKSFSFEISTFNFSNPDKIIYEYNLEGYDNAWHQTTAGATQISFTGVPYGEYVLNIRAKLGNNVSAVTHVNLIVTPMWWQTNWAFLLYLLVVLIIVIGIRLLSSSSKKMRADLLEYEHNKEIDDAKFQFFFNISHEIRTPLTLIINPIRELMNNTDASNDDKRNYNLIYRNSMRIMRLINQMMDVRKFERERENLKMDFSHTNFPEFIENIMLSFNVLAKKKNIAMKFDNNLFNPMVDIDIDNFDKVVYNIYSNAIKFTREGEICTILEEKENNIIITFKDSGVGIDPLLTEKIFDRFYQIENEANANYVGTGVGLHLTRQIVEAHGGTIVASNRTDSKIGTIFTVTIPRHHEGSTDEIKGEETDFAYNNIPEEKYRPVSNKKILIVDDEIDVNEYLTAKLARQYKITSCNNGREAYEKLLKEPFDLVISDIMMPEMNGLTLCRKIKSNININQIPVILLTAKHSDDDRNQGLMSGADAYISKPFDLEILRTTIANILANRDRIIPHIQKNMPESKPLDMKNADEILLEKVIAYIDANLSDPDMNAEKIAQHVGMSRTHFHRRIKEITGQNARDFVRNARLKHAGKLLSEKHFNVSEVAYALGFSNVSHFATSFKNFYGMTPTDYMKEHANK